MKIFRTLFFICLTFLPFSFIRADFTSANFQLENPIDIIEGSQSFSSSFQYFGSTGQLTVGQSTSARFVQNAGFLYLPFASRLIVFPTGNNSSINLAWSIPQGFFGWTISSYSVGQSTVPGGPYTFTEVENVTNKNITGLSNNTRYYFVVRAEDIFGSPIVVSPEVSSVPTAPIAMAPASNQVIIDASLSSYTIDVPSTVSTPNIDVSSISTTSGGITVAIVDGSISINSETSIGHVDVDIPAGANISGSSATWDGIIDLPQVRSNSSVAPTPDFGMTATVSKAIEIGAGDVSLTTDKAVRISIPGEAGKFAGYSIGGVFTRITDACSNDSQSVGDALSAGGNCKIDVGNDMIIWTKHFTVFVTYTEASTAYTNSVTSNTGGGGNGNSSLTSNTINFSGRAYPNSAVVLMEDAQVLVSTVAGGDANFTISANNLSTGNHVFSIYSEDSQGNRSPLLTFPVSLTTNNSTSVGGIFLAPTISTDKTEVKKGDNITFFGQSAPNSEVTISIHSSQEIFKKINSDKNGVYLQVIDSSALDLGNHIAKSKAATNGEISSYGNTVAFVVSDKNIAKQKTTVTFAKADLNGDSKVNLVDFSILAYWYGKKNPPTDIDLNHDGVVNLVDFSIMAYYCTK